MYKEYMYKAAMRQIPNIIVYRMTLYSYVILQPMHKNMYYRYAPSLAIYVTRIPPYVMT